MSPDLFFWYALAFKVAMTATIVVVVSVAAERSGPFIAALIAALPTAAGATYIILALEHPPAFIAASANRQHGRQRRCCDLPRSPTPRSRSAAASCSA